MADTPIANGANGGRDPRTGRFLPGNPGGKGNPNARQVSEFRRSLLGAVTAEDIADVIRAVLERAKAGDVMAAREVLDRTVGPANKAELHIGEGGGFQVVILPSADGSSVDLPQPVSSGSRTQVQTKAIDSTTPTDAAVVSTVDTADPDVRPDVRSDAEKGVSDG